MLNTYSMKSDKDINVSNHFKVKEFACKDGSDIVKIDDRLIELLETLRLKVGMPITITSGYRTETYNERCGGANNSYHLKGMAVDIKCNMDPILVGLYAAALGFKGIGIYKDFTHIDVRETSYMWKG